MLILWILIFPGLTSATLKNYDNEPESDYYLPGDINLGMIRTLECGMKTPLGSWVTRFVQGVNAIIFRINEVNNDTSILPNISLGVVVLDDCGTIAGGLYQVSKIIPLDGCTKDCCDLPVVGAANPTVRGCYNVAAALTSFTSGMNIAQSQLLSLYKIPHISETASSVLLSDRKQYEYFNRFSPPDNTLIKAIMDMLVTFKWTYISLIGDPSVYSRSGMSEIRVLAKKYNICIAYSVELLHDVYINEDYDEVVRMLRKHSKARVVIIFSGYLSEILDAVSRSQAHGEFIFIVGDAVSFPKRLSYINNLELDYAEDQSRPYRSFIDYYKKLSPWVHYDTPGVFEKHTSEDWNCSMNLKKGENGSCKNYEVLGDLPNHYIYPDYRYQVDAINVLIIALDTMIRQKCPSAFNDKSLLKACVNGPDLLNYIRNISFEGYRFNKIRFDAKGDGLSGLTFDVRQLQPDGNGGAKYVKVGKFSVNDKKSYLDMNKFNWFSFNETFHQTRTDTPVSVCAKPCKLGEFYIQREEECCWECHQCRDNEVVSDNLRGCNICPFTTWPDQGNFTTCLPIPPSYMEWQDPIALGLLGLSGIGLVSTITILCIFVKHQKKKVVKGSSLEQMMTIVLALYLSYTTAILLVAKPVYSLCLMQYYCFHLSCTLIFVPLLLKTTRIYRIFAAAERCQQVIRFVSRKALGLFSLILISILVSINQRTKLCLYICSDSY